MKYLISHSIDLSINFNMASSWQTAYLYLLLVVFSRISNIFVKCLVMFNIIFSRFFKLGIYILKFDLFVYKIPVGNVYWGYGSRAHRQMKCKNRRSAMEERQDCLYWKIKYCVFNNFVVK